MKGIAATMVRLLYVSRMQRWLAGCGFALMLGALGARTAGWQQVDRSVLALAGAVGAMLIVIAPVVAGPMLFSAMVTQRTTALIPRGRLKLVLGAACSQLLLAMFIAATLGAMRSAPVHTVLAIAFGALTYFFLGFSLAVYSRTAFFIWLPTLCLAPMLVASFPQLHLGTRIASPRGLLVVVAASILAWTVHGVRVIRSRRGTQRPWSFASFLPAPRSHTLRDAMLIVLTGNANIRRVIILVVLFFGAVFIGLTLLTAGAPHPRGNPAFFFALTVCFMAALIPGILSGIMARRARRLWLVAAMGRAELFTAIERQCWRLMFIALGMALLMAVPLVAVGNHSAPDLMTLVAIPTVPLSCGGMLVYAGLLYIRGNRFVDILIVGGNALLLTAVELSAVANAHAFPALLGIQIVLLPLLRRMAWGRWNHIDWLVLRQPPMASRLV